MSIFSMHLIKTSSYLAGRITKCPEVLRIGDNSFSWKSRYGLEIKSFQYPEINPRAIYLIGCWPQMDSDMFSLSPRDETVDSYFDRLVKSVKEFLEAKFCRSFIVEVENLGIGGMLISFNEYDGTTNLFTKE